jgi:hypothetical protein
MADMDAQLAREIAAAALAHEAERYATTAALVRQDEASQKQLRAATRRLQDAAQAWCQAYGHQGAP